MDDDPTALPLTPPSTLDVVIGLAEMMATCAAEQLQRIDQLRRAYLDDAAVTGTGYSDVVMRGLRLEIAAAMRITEYSAGALLALSEALVHRYPSALRALADARITQRHAEILVDGVDAVEPDSRARLLDQALALAEEQPVGQFRRSMRTLVESAGVITLAERHAAALEHRRVFVEPVGNGMAWTNMLGPAVEAHALYGRATAIAKTILAQDGETRTLDQIRADVVADLLIDGTTPDHPTESRGIRATVVVTVPALALLEATDADVAATGADPARVEGVGPIPIGRAKELCGGESGWMRVLTHPETGMVLSVGRTQYAPPNALRRLVTWRADRCMGPGCGMPASRCEVDHTLAWQHGGDTALQNLAPLCRGHHKVKHHGGWQLRQLPDGGGAVEWISPAGRRYVVAPERRVPVFTATDPPGVDLRSGAAPF
jgi:hypothetical protein